MKVKFFVLAILCLMSIFLSACEKEDFSLTIKKEAFGTAEGKQIDLYTLTNSNGVKAKIINYGAILFSLELPDRDGNAADVTLGYGSLDEYVKNRNYFGATIGRYGNRIAKGRFALDGTEYTLATNNGENHLHGGLKGFNKVVWDSEPITTKDSVGVRLTYLSVDGEEGYPGNLTCTVVYTLTNNDELRVDYEATTDKSTPVNLTHHSFWNLAGNASRDILGHELMLNADHFLPVDSGLIPTGEIKSVKGSPMDFTTPATIGSRIEQVEGGYDHNYVLNRQTHGEELILAGRVYEPVSGRGMEIYTTEPGIQFYSGNFFDGTTTGKGGKVYGKHYAFCLETQHFPDSPNQLDFPTTILNPGQTYTHVCVHKFYTK